MVICDTDMPLRSTKSFAGAAGMLLHMNEKFTKGKLKSSLLS